MPSVRLATGSTGKTKLKHPLCSVHCSISLLPGARHRQSCKSTFPTRAALLSAALPGSAPVRAPAQLWGIRMRQTGPPPPRAPRCSREPPLALG